MLARGNFCRICLSDWGHGPVGAYSKNSIVDESFQANTTIGFI